MHFIGAVVFSESFQVSHQELYDHRSMMQMLHFQNLISGYLVHGFRLKLSEATFGICKPIGGRETRFKSFSGDLKPSAKKYIPINLLDSLSGIVFPKF